MIFAGEAGPSTTREVWIFCGNRQELVLRAPLSPIDRARRPARHEDPVYYTTSENDAGAHYQCNVEAA
jgi:hypothetical protein